jgi:hypothetical protein
MRDPPVLHQYSIIFRDFCRQAVRSSALPTGFADSAAFKVTGCRDLGNAGPGGASLVWPGRRPAMTTPGGPKVPESVQTASIARSAPILKPPIACARSFQARSDPAVLAWGVTEAGRRPYGHWGARCHGRQGFEGDRAGEYSE